jgi:acetyltransferase-like isoleucine patch superfamily enzyme
MADQVTIAPLGRTSSCRDSHQELLQKVPPGSAAVDAIIVAASRPAEHLTAAADLGEQLGAFVTVLCSHSATSADFAELAVRRPGLRWHAVDLPPDYHHPLFDFETSKAEDVKVGRLGDLSAKRNVGLALAKLLGWDSCLFLDDDIEGIDPSQVRQGASALRELRMVGLEVADFPDNSVVCHANRLTGAHQQTFISGSALLVDTRHVDSYFPEIYNEDWLFFFDAANRRQIGRVGNVTQLPYLPFADPDRAVGEEYGDVFAEGLMELAHTKGSRSEAEDPRFWRGFLAARARFIDHIASALNTHHATAVELSALKALEAAEARRSTIAPESCAAYARTWFADIPQWALRLSAVPHMTTITSALQHLELAPTDGFAVPPKRTTPVTQIAPTAQIGAPYRRLQAGEWSRLNRETFIGEGCDIGHFSLIGEEAHLGDGTIIDAYCMVEGGATLGKNVLLTHRASVGAKATIGDDCIIGGTLICEKSWVGKNCRVFGDLIHRQLNPTADWDAPEAEEPAPHLEDNVFVGWGATVIGRINIGEGSYICAGATVTKHVPAHHIVTGTNQFHTPQEWNGSLAKSPFFAQS